jgi:hypothetical protein
MRRLYSASESVTDLGDSFGRSGGWAAAEVVHGDEHGGQRSRLECGHD